MWTNTFNSGIDIVWQRSDGAEVFYDMSVYCSTAQPWLPNHRGFKAVDKDGNCFVFIKHRPGYVMNKIGIARKFKTPEAAMKAFDKAYPL